LGITTTFPPEQLDADACISDFSDVRVDKAENHHGIRILVTSA
jgi:hypothetical protein